MADIHYARLSELKQRQGDMYAYSEALADIDRAMDEDEAARIAQEIENAILGEGRMQNLESDPLIDLRVAAISGNYNISINASELGNGMPESIAIGIVNVNGDTLETRHRYSRDRVEIEELVEDNPVEENSGMSSLYEQTKSMLLEKGFTLTEAGDKGDDYLICDKDDLIVGEIVLELDNENEIKNMYLRDMGGRTNSVEELEDAEKFIGKLEENDKYRHPEAEEITFEEAVQNNESNSIYEVGEDTLSEADGFVQVGDISLEEVKESADIPAEEENINNDSFNKEDVMSEFENVTEENTIDEEANPLGITPDMSEREMAAKAVDVINDGAEPTKKQEKWINGFDDHMKESDILKGELESINEHINELNVDIATDEGKLEKLEAQLARQISIAKMNGCDKDNLKGMENTINNIKETTDKLNQHRNELVSEEKAAADKEKEVRAAERAEYLNGIKDKYEKVQNTLSNGVKTGLGALGKIKDSIERVNIKVMEYTETRKITSAYKDLAREVDEINRDYVRTMEYLKADLERDTKALEKVTGRAERMAEIRGTLKDLGRLMTGREAVHDYSLSDKEKEKIQDLRDRVDGTKSNMENVDRKYQNEVSAKEDTMNDLTAKLAGRGRSIDSLFSDVVKNAYARSSEQAKNTHNEQQKVNEAR